MTARTKVMKRNAESRTTNWQTRHVATRSVVVAIAATLMATPSAAQTSASDEVELRRITQELLDAVAPAKVEVWQRYLHERLIHVDENGVVRGKDELLKELTPLPKELVGRIEIDDFEANVHGDVAIVAHEDQEHLDYYGQTLRSRFRSTDTWLKTPAGWRLIGAQIAAVVKDPPSVKLTNEQLCAYNGSYALTEAITSRIQCTQEGLKIERADRPDVTYIAELIDVFFVPGQPRTRRIFLRDSNGKVTGFVDRREGEDVRWLKRS